MTLLNSNARCCVAYEAPVVFPGISKEGRRVRASVFGTLASTVLGLQF